MRNLFGQEQWARRGEAQAAAATAVSAAMPVGAIIAYWGTVAPTGWLLCDGAAIPAAYAALITLVGANTPNLKGRVIVGIDAAQAEFDALGETGGAKTVAIASGNLPVHTHGMQNHTHTGTSGTENLPHQHQIAKTRTNLTTHAHDGDANEVSFTPTSPNTFFGTAITTGNQTANHTHGFTSGGPSDNTTTDGGFAGTALANLQPYAALSYIIKAA